MADSGGIRAGKAFIELFLSGPFNKQLDAAAKKLKDVGQNIADIGKRTLAIGTAITAPLLIAAQRFGAMGEEMAKASEKTGVGVEALSALKYAADQVGVGFDQLQGGIGKMQKTLFAAAGGSAEAVKALEGIGLTVEDLKNLSPEEQFGKIADGLNAISDPAARTGEAMAIFGKSGAELLPLLDQGSAAMAEMRKHAEELGIVMSDKDAKAGRAFNQTLKDLLAQAQALTFQIGAAVAQALQPFLLKLEPIVKSVIDWAKANRPLIIGLLTTGVAISAVGGALLGVGYAIKGVGIALSGISSLFSVVTSAVGLLASPLGVVTLLLIGGVAALVYFTHNAGKLLSWVEGRFNELKNTAVEAFGGIADALAAGDILLAAQILWTGLKLAWLQGTQKLQEYWLRFKAAALEVSIDTFYGILNTWTNVSAKLREAWAETVSFFGSLWDGFIGSFTNAWNVAIGTVEKGINKLHGLWDKKFDANKANDAIDNKNIEANNAHQKEEMDARRKREQDLAAELAKVEAERQKKIADNAKRSNDLIGAVNGGADKDVADLEAKKKDLQKQLDDLRGQAGKEKAAGSNRYDSFIKPEKLQDLDDVVGKRGSDLKSQGLFNIAALQSLQSAPTQEAIKKAAEETAKNTKRLIDLSPRFT